MQVTTGLVRIQPWNSVEYVTVRATETPDVYRVIYDNDDLCSVHATNHQDLIDGATKAWRRKFPDAP